MPVGLAAADSLNVSPASPAGIGRWPGLRSPRDFWAWK
eukprot:SAG31_NODE_28929_length_403_cov_1.006579_1_plen_37_part_10